MPDRLQELLRQKALLAEQTAWLEREIIAEQQRAGISVPAAAAPAEPSGPPAASVPALVEEEANAILEQYRSNPRSLQHEIRRGCFLYFFGGLALVGLVVVVIYLTLRVK